MPPAPYYSDAHCTIYLGDNADLLPELSPCDLLLTDPPYGIKIAKNGIIGKGGTDFGRVKWDDSPPSRDILEMAMKKATWQIIWGGGHMGEMPKAKCWLVWDKKRDNTCFSCCELAWTNLRRNVRIFRWRWNGCLQEDMKNKEKRIHPCQKPLPLMQWCLSLAHAKSTVLDPWMGAGSTLVASKIAGHKCIGIEREERYCELAARRLQEI